MNIKTTENQTGSDWLPCCPHLVVLKNTDFSVIRKKKERKVLMKQTFNISAYSSKVFVISCCWRQTSKEKKSLSPGDTWFLIHSLKYKIIQSLTFIFLTFF